jgi:hypothetical protein
MPRGKKSSKKQMCSVWGCSMSSVMSSEKHTCSVWGCSMSSVTFKWLQLQPPRARRSQILVASSNAPP